MGKIAKNLDGWRIYYNIAVYDSDTKPSWYETTAKGKKVRVYNPYAAKWLGMLERSLSSKFKQSNPSYSNTTVCKEWLTFSNFKAWVDSQPNRDWVNLQLDKDLKFRNNDEYNKDSCIFVTQKVNTFVTNNKSRRSGLLGVTKFDQPRAYLASCRNPFTLVQEKLGYFYTEREAHLAWKNRKHELALQLADLQDCEIVKEILCQMYSPDKDWTTQ